MRDCFPAGCDLPVKKITSIFMLNMIYFCHDADFLYDETCQNEFFDIIDNCEKKG